MDQHDIEIRELMKICEMTFGKSLLTPTDFDLFSEAVQLKTKNNISESTLKRIWGYLKEDRKPHISTLNILCSYIGRESFMAFCKELKEEQNIESDFVVHQQVITNRLEKGTQIEVGWSPNRHITIKYLGNYRFEVIESINSKLHAGDNFECVGFMVGQPMHIIDIVRGNMRIKSYISGCKTGITFVNVL